MKLFPQSKLTSGAVPTSDGPSIVNTSSPKRFEFVDVVRGLAAILVMIDHSIEDSRLPHLWNGALMWLDYGAIGLVGVVMFFCVSGFVIPLSLEKSNNLKSFWVSRAFRIYPLYAFVFGLTLLGLPTQWYMDVNQALVSVGAHFAFVQSYMPIYPFVGGSWTLMLEAIWYVAFSALFFFKLNHRLWVVVGGSVALSLVAQALTLAGVNIPLGRISLLVTCILGLIFYRNMMGQLTGRAFTVSLFTLMGFIMANMTLRDVLRDDVSFTGQVLPWALAMAGFSLAYFTRHLSVWSHKVLRFFGEISYSLYLVHFMIIIWLKSIPGLDGPLFIAAVFACSIPLAHLTHRTIEKPMIKLGQALFSKPPSGHAVLKKRIASGLR